jgi:hypothetical protein
MNGSKIRHQNFHTLFENLIALEPASRAGPDGPGARSCQPIARRRQGKAVHRDSTDQHAGRNPALSPRTPVQPLIRKFRKHACIGLWPLHRAFGKVNGMPQGGD